MKEKISFKQMFLALTIMVLQVASVYYMLKGRGEGIILALITFGPDTAPSVISKYFDAVFTQSLPSVRKKLTDNIGADNAILDKLMSSEAYESYPGGTDIEEPLMYGLSSMDWYDGADPLPDGDVDGVTMAVFEAKQAASPVSYTMKDIIRNRMKILSFVETKLKQSEMGVSEGFSQATVLGAGDGGTRTPRTGASGASAISPIHKLIDFTPTTSSVIGNLNQSTYTWWRNRTKTSTLSTYDGLLFEMNNLFNTISLGTGGMPNLCLVDQVTYELVNFALYSKYRQTTADPLFKFNNTKLPFGNGSCVMVMDEKMIDVYSDTVPTQYGGAGLTYGSAFFINTKFLKLRYIPDRDFEMLEDENGKTFAKPLKGDSRLGHVAWMGELTVNNRRKQGVLGKIPRTLTVS